MKYNWDKILTECFTKLYANSEPKADFGELMKFAKDNNVIAEDGRLDIKCSNYEIKESKFKEIFDSCVKKYKIKEPWLRAFSSRFTLGHHQKQYQMTKTEFFDRLKEGKWLEQPQALIDYRLPVVQYYLKNYTNTALMVNGGRVIQSREVNIVYNKNTDFCLLNWAYERILEQFKKGEIR